MLNRDKLDEFTRAYVAAALWSTSDKSDDAGGEPMDSNYGIGDVADATLEQMVKDCAVFQARYARILSRLTERHGRGDEYHGHDFWLTRCGHGVGFWDRGYGKLGDALTAACEEWGNVDLYVGDDGRIHA